MSIEYTLHPNLLNGMSGTYAARVKSARTADVEQLAQHIVDRGSTITKADIVCVLEDLFATMETLLLDGWNITTPAVNCRVTIRGTFTGSDDGFDPGRHQLVARLRPGPRLKRALKTRATVAKQLPGGAALPVPLAYIDANSGARNSVLTPGGMGRVTGGRLQFSATRPEEGIFFLASGGAETKAQVVDLNRDTTVSFLVPALPAGEYELEVRTATEIGSMRRGRLPFVLTVS